MKNFENFMKNMKKFTTNKKKKKEKTFANHLSNKGFVSEIYKEFFHLKIKGQ